MPNHGKRGNGRGGGRGRGRGRGRGHGNIGSGGRGRNRQLFPSSVGFIYRPTSNVEDEDDFRVYGQFSSDDDSGPEISYKNHSKKKASNSKRNNNLGFVKESRPSFGSNYDDHYDESMNRAGLGMPSTIAAARSNSNTERQFAKGNSKYLKTVLFTKSSSSIDSTNEKVIVQKAITQESSSVIKEEAIVESFSKMTVGDFAIKEFDKSEEVQNDKLSLSKTSGRSRGSSAKPHSSVEVIDYTELDIANVDGNSKSNKHENVLINDKYQEKTKMDEVSTADSRGKDISSEEESSFIEDLEESEDGSEEEEFFYGENDTDDDELLEEDMLIMEDYLDNIELEEGEDLNDLLAWSAMQEGNLEIEIDTDGEEENAFDYADLDKTPNQRSLSDFEEEEELILAQSNKSIYANESFKKKVSHRTQVDDTIVDPEIFGQTLKAALADCPPGLRPGMRRWYEKQQRKEDRKKKKEEAKAHRREKKKNGKGKEKENDEDFTNQMAKIDDRLREFIQDESITSFQFAPMNTNVRRQLHVLAAAYNLKSKSTGGGGSRCTVVTKTTTTYIPSDRRYISRFLTDIQTNMDEQNRIIGKNRSKGTPLKGKQKIINKKKKSSNSSTPKEKRGDAQFPAGPSHGTVVAFDAAPIGESNVGHRMLAAMGWKQGEALGSKSDGIVAPIEAIIRKKGRGLGS